MAPFVAAGGRSYGSLVFCWVWLSPAGAGSYGALVGRKIWGRTEFSLVAALGPLLRGLGGFVGFGYRPLGRAPTANQGLVGARPSGRFLRHKSGSGGRQDVDTFGACFQQCLGQLIGCRTSSDNVVNDQRLPVTETFAGFESVAQITVPLGGA